MTPLDISKLPTITGSVSAPLGLLVALLWKQACPGRPCPVSFISGREHTSAVVNEHADLSPALRSALAIAARVIYPRGGYVTAFTIADPGQGAVAAKPFASYVPARGWVETSWAPPHDLAGEFHKAVHDQLLDGLPSPYLVMPADLRASLETIAAGYAYRPDASPLEAAASAVERWANGLARSGHAPPRWLIDTTREWTTQWDAPEAVRIACIRALRGYFIDELAGARRDVVLAVQAVHKADARRLRRPTRQAQQSLETRRRNARKRLDERREHVASMELAVSAPTAFAHREYRAHLKALREREREQAKWDARRAKAEAARNARWQAKQAVKQAAREARQAAKAARQVEREAQRAAKAARRQAREAARAARADAIARGASKQVAALAYRRAKHAALPPPERTPPAPAARKETPAQRRKREAGEQVRAAIAEHRAEGERLRAARLEGEAVRKIQVHMRRGRPYHIPPELEHHFDLDRAVADAEEVLRRWFAGELGAAA